MQSELTYSNTSMNANLLFCILTLLDVVNPLYKPSIFQMSLVQFNLYGKGTVCIGVADGKKHFLFAKTGARPQNILKCRGPEIPFPALFHIGCNLH